jgi:ABC-type amino acid transport substrate-binding protein
MTKPTIEQLTDEFAKKLDDFTAEGQAQRFFNYYESKDWMVGKNKMKKWQAAVNNWILNMNKYGTSTNNQPVTNRIQALSSLQ